MFVVRKGIMTIPDKTSASITNIQSPIKQDMFFAKMSYLLYSIINNSVSKGVAILQTPTAKLAPDFHSSKVKKFKF